MSELNDFVQCRDCYRSADWMSGAGPLSSVEGSPRQDAFEVAIGQLEGRGRGCDVTAGVLGGVSDRLAGWLSPSCCCGMRGAGRSDTPQADARSGACSRWQVFDLPPVSVRVTKLRCGTATCGQVLAGVGAAQVSNRPRSSFTSMLGSSCPS